MIVLHLLQLYSVKSQGNAVMSTGVKSFQYIIDIYIFFTVYVQHCQCSQAIFPHTRAQVRFESLERAEAPFRGGRRHWHRQQNTKHLVQVR